MKSIAVTGMGIICAIGNDAAQVSDSLREGRSGIGPVKYLDTVHRDLPVGEIKMSDEQMRQVLGLPALAGTADDAAAPDGTALYGRTTLMGAIALRQALNGRNSGGAHGGTGGRQTFAGKRVVLISGTTVGNLDVTEKYFERMKSDDALLALPHSNECGESTVQMAALAGLGPETEVCTISTARSAALLSALKALKAAGLQRPDAIVSATSCGMLETSQQFLADINAGGEQLLKPTLFMQSTHNTIGSAIAIRTGCHGYNITYSQGEDSLKWALRDAERLISTGRATNVLVCRFDESTPVFDDFCLRSGVSAPPVLAAECRILVRQIPF